MISKSELQEISSSLILCIAGPWKNRMELVQDIATYKNRQFVYKGGLLIDLSGRAQVRMIFEGPDACIGQAFRFAGQGMLQEDLLHSIEGHQSVVYLEFAPDMIAQHALMCNVTQMLHELGGYAVKVESSGIAHTWGRWFELLDGNEFDWYSAVVCLIGSDEYYFSCGMHLFGLPESAVPKSVPMDEATDLINRFNCWRIVDDPVLTLGETFSVSEKAMRYELMLEKDWTHDKGDLFYNPDGVWVLQPV